MYLSPDGDNRICESDWLRSNGRSEGPVFGCSASASELKSACSRTIQNASANCLLRGAHHRRCAREGLTVVDYALLKANWQADMGLPVKWQFAVEALRHSVSKRAIYEIH